MTSLNASEPITAGDLRRYIRHETFGILASLPYVCELRPRDRRFCQYYLARSRRQVLSPIAALAETLVLNSHHFSGVLRVLRAVIVTTCKQGEILNASRPALGDVLVSLGNLLFERESRLLRVAIAVRLHEEQAEAEEKANELAPPPLH